MSSTEYLMLQTLIGELSLRANQIAKDPRACQKLAAGVQKALGLTADETVDLLKTHFQPGDYIEKAATDPAPGPMTRLPLRDALADVNVELVEVNEVTGMMLRCIFCGTMWRPAGYQGGDLRRPVKGFQKCPQGCNASATFKWDEGKPPSYNPLAEYRQS